MSYFVEAEKKIKSSVVQAEKGGNKEKVIAKPIADALLTFCKQNEEFAQAVVQGKNFEDCVKSVARNIGSACSDLTVYQKAVDFYFPGAVIELQMNIKMSKYEAEPNNIISLNFMDFI